MLRPIGDICKLEMKRIQNRFHIVVDKYIIMPNHVHMIIVIGQERAEQSPAPTCMYINTALVYAVRINEGCVTL